MVLYFFVTSLLALPRVRTLWILSPIVHTQAILWTLVTVGTFMVLCLESIHKTRIVRLAYRETSKESTSSFWIRSFFIWVIPLFRSGFSTILSVHDMPDIDRALRGDTAEEKLQAAWARSEAFQHSRLHDEMI
jgi:ATP-binding cassette subfamily C (CFTR/MRP) protein 1